jgi:hypothetical protein
MFAQSERPALNLSISESTLHVQLSLPKDVKQVELQLESSRNQPITRFSTISPYDPDSISRRAKYNRTDHDIWFPVLDVVLEKGMEGVCIFKGHPEGTYTFGGPYYNDEKPIEKQIILPNSRLEPWENSLQVSSKAIEIEQCYLRKTYPVLLSEFRQDIQLLTKDWSGTVRVFANTENGAIKLAERRIEAPQEEWNNTTLAKMKGSSMNETRLLEALKANIDDGLRRQNLDPDSPTYGSFHTFYDLEARLHRTSYWLWGGSPLVKMTLDALHIPEIIQAFDSAALVAKMEKVGQLYIKYQVREKGHPSRGSYLVIWNRNPSGYLKWVGTSDSGIMHKWAMMPLYKATGKKEYLESTVFWCEQKGELLKDHEILPHNFLYDEGKFNDGILDETGWDPEGHAALYEVTKSEKHKQIAKEYMDKHMAKFQNEDGLWNRNYSLSQKTANPPARMTRGTGWAMEGLLAMNEMFPNTEYLDYAVKMGDQVMEHQNDDGSWNFVFDAPEDSPLAIPSDKATPLWSLLFYRLHTATGNKKYLETAQKALGWCLENQYTGPDPEAIGGLAGRTNASMVGYRYYYDATCAYATGFFGLAILEELKLTKTKKL